MKTSEISNLLQTSPTVTQIINDLEKEGLVIRQTDPSDRRAVKIHKKKKDFMNPIPV